MDQKYAEDSTDYRNATLGEDQISKWKEDLESLIAQRKNVLDRLLDDCLDKVLPICHDRELKDRLKQ